jgi:hypothetical protein
VIVPLPEAKATAYRDSFTTLAAMTVRGSLLPGWGPLLLGARCRRHRGVRTTRSMSAQIVYLTSESILNIGRYIEITITPTMAPTMIIISGSMIDVSVEIAESTSSS